MMGTSTAAAHLSLLISRSFTTKDREMSNETTTKDHNQ